MNKQKTNQTIRVSKVLPRKEFAGAMWRVKELPGMLMSCTPQGGWRFLLWSEHSQKEKDCYSKLKGQRFSTRQEALQALEAVMLLQGVD